MSSQTPITEDTIRPHDIFEEYLRLATLDIETYFRGVDMVHIDCPVCKIPGKGVFTKSGFTYEECSDCKSLYVNPRPCTEAFDKYYTDSPSTKFWATTFYKITESARRETLWKPKANLVKLTIERYRHSNESINIIDIGGGYGVFDEEINAIMKANCVIIEPSVHLAEICRNKGFKTIEKFMEDVDSDEIPKGNNCFVSFELFEHLHDPGQFLQTLYKIMREGDLFIFTTLSGMGIDIQILRENSRSVSPPHHLNFLNPKSLSTLLRNTGFEVMEAATPGKLDMDILFKNKDIIQDNFWRNYFDYSSEEDRNAMQLSIAANGLSSHMMMTCRKTAKN
jgi:hypothetical protein